MPIFLQEAPTLTIRPLVELRERYERKIDKDFNSSAQDNRSDLLSQWRLGIGWEYGKEWKGELRYQYAHDLIWKNQLNSALDSSDVDLAFVEHPIGKWTARIGRQRLPIAHQRLFENSTWNNVGKSFDLVRVQNKELDFFAGKAGLLPISARQVRLAGAHLTSAAGETLYAYKHDRAVAGSIEIHTIDHDWGQGFSWGRINVEAALQVGSVTGKTHRAWAYNGMIIGNPIGKVTPTVEFAAASGGNSATSSSTFDMLYGAGHDRYGMLDLSGWRNMNKLAVTAEMQATKQLKGKVTWGTYSLRDSHDAWYNQSGGTNVHSDPTGQSGRYLGQELDFALTGTIDPKTTVGVGIGVFQPGSWVRKVTGHGDRHVYGYAYAQYKY